MSQPPDGDRRWHDDHHDDHDPDVGHHDGPAPEHHSYEDDGEHHDSLADVLVGGTHEHEEAGAHEQPAQSRAESRYRERQRSRWPLRVLTIVVAVAVVLAGGFYGLRSIGDFMPSLELSSAPEDYEGSGSGEVIIEVPEGAGGGEIGQILAQEDVVASASAFTSVAAADDRSSGIQPGVYQMANQMSASSALERLLDNQYRQSAQVTIPEGLWVSEVFARLAEATDNEVSAYEDVAVEDLELPGAANGELEGFLFPETYSFDPDETPTQQLQSMIDHGLERFAELEAGQGQNLRRTLIVASLVQGEASAAEDLARVSRVVENRLDEEQPLGFDSTIHYIAQERGRAGTTDEQRAVESPYNTYTQEGLPPGPINNPGAAAIEAALNPAEGNWLYFVTVNPDSGETVFAETYEEHLENQEEFQQWCADNPDRC